MLPPEPEANMVERESPSAISSEEHLEAQLEAQSSFVEEGIISHPLQGSQQALPGDDGDNDEQSPEDAAAGDKDDDDDDDDDVTVIVLDHGPPEGEGQRLTIAWSGEAGPEVEERRRSIMLRELQRVQRTSFLHFMILCLIPTVLLFIVIATVISEDENCYSEATVCIKESRNFINAFTTRCVCEAIAVKKIN